MEVESVIDLGESIESLFLDAGARRNAEGEVRRESRLLKGDFLPMPSLR